MRKKKYKFLLGILFLFALTGTAITFSLPWWLNTNFARQIVIDQLARDLERAVSIDHMSGSWSKGICLEGLTIQRKNRFGSGKLLSIAKLRIPFQPRQLLKKQINHLRISNADLFVVLSRKGRINIRDLPPLDFDINLIDLRGFRVHCLTRSAKTSSESVIAINSATLRKNISRGSISWELQAQQSNTTSATISSQGLWDPTNRQGSHASLALREIDLHTLQAESWLNLLLPRPGEKDFNLSNGSIRQLSGKCSLDIQIEVNQQSLLKGNGKLTLNQLNIRAGEKNTPETSWINKANLHTDVRFQYNLLKNKFQIPRLSFTGNGVSFQAKGKYHRPSPEEAGIWSLSMNEGQLEIQKLQAAFPLLERLEFLKKHAPGCGGRLNFAVNYAGLRHYDQVHLLLDGTAMNLSAGGWHKPAGKPLRLDLQSQLHRKTKQLNVKAFRLQCMSTNIEGNLHIPCLAKIFNASFSGPTQENIRTILQQNEGFDVQLLMNNSDCNDIIKNVRGWFGAPEELYCEGPLNAELSLSGKKDKTEIKARLTCPNESVFVLKNIVAPAEKVLLHKKSNSILTASLTTNLLYQPLSLEQILVKTRLGKGRFTFGPGSILRQEDDHDPNEFHLQGAFRLDHIENGLTGLPGWQSYLKQRNIDIDGAVEGYITCLRQKKHISRLAGEILCDQLKLNVAKSPLADFSDHTADDLLFSKAPDKKGRVKFYINQPRFGGELSYFCAARMDHLHAQSRGKITLKNNVASKASSIESGQFLIKFYSNKLENTRDIFPVFLNVHDGLSLADLQGQAQGRANIHFDRKDISLEFALRADDSRFLLQRLSPKHNQSPAAAGPTSARGELKNQSISFMFPETKDRDILPLNKHMVLWAKAAGIPCRLTGELSLSHPVNLLAPGREKDTNSSLPVNITIKKFELLLADSWGRLSGQGEYENPSENKKISLSSFRGQLRLQARLNHEDDLCSQAAFLSPLQKKGKLTGHSQYFAQLLWSPESNSWRGNTQIDLTKTGCEFTLPVRPDQISEVTLHKPAGDMLELTLDAKTEKHAADLHINQFKVELPETTLDCKAVFESVDWKVLSEAPRKIPFDTAQLKVQLDSHQFSPLRKWLTPSFPPSIEGQIHITVPISMQFTPFFQATIASARADARLQNNGTDTPLGVRLTDMWISPAQLILPDFQLRIGNNDATIVADITNPLSFLKTSMAHSCPPRGKIHILADRIDVDFLQNYIRSFNKDKSTYREKPARFDPNQIIPSLRQYDLAGSFDIAALRYTDIASRVRMKLDELRCGYRWRDGVAKMEFCTGLNGGVVNGSVQCDLNQPIAMVTYHQVSRELQADDALRPLVESQFPGLEVYGTINEKLHRTSSLLDLIKNPQKWTDTGTNICTKGFLYGPGGPRWILNLFPNLQLLEYPWDKMVNQYNTSCEGEKHNCMFFYGPRYDIYIEGVSRPVPAGPEYQYIMKALRSDSLALQEKLRSLNISFAKSNEANQRKTRWLRRRMRGLKQLWQRHQAGEFLNVVEANYVIGSLFSTKTKDFFDVPVPILRLPYFHSHSYIIDQFMIDSKTTSFRITPEKKYRLINKNLNRNTTSR